MKNWLRSILGFLVLSSCLCQLLPEGQYRKYGRLLCGMILLILVFQPLLSFSGFEGRLRASYQKLSYLEEEEKVEKELARAEEGQKERVLSAYRKWIREQAEELCQEKGFSMTFLEADVSGEGEVLAVRFGVSYRKEVGISVEPVQLQEGTGERIQTVETEKLAREFCGRTELSEGQVEVWLEK